MKIANIDREIVQTAERLDQFQWNFQERCALWQL